MPSRVRGIVIRLVSRLAGLAGHGTALTHIGAWLLGAVVLAIAITVWDLRQDALGTALRNTENLATVLAEQTSRMVQSVDIVMREVQERIAGLPVETPEEFRGALASKDMYDFLRSRTERVPQVDDIALIAADGSRVSNSVGWPTVPADLSDRDYARHFATGDDPNLFVSEPVISRATHVWTIYLARRVKGPTGRYLGIILAAIPLKEFANPHYAAQLTGMVQTADLM